MRAHVAADSHMPARTVGKWLDEWLAGKVSLKRSTRAAYRSHIDTYLKPYLGDIELRQLHTGHIVATFTAIAVKAEEITSANQRRRELNAQVRAAGSAPKCGKREHLLRELGQLPAHRVPPGPVTRQRIRATLRSALSDASKNGLIDSNPATPVPLWSVRRVAARMWTDARVRQWQQKFQRQLDALGSAPTRSQVVKAWRASPRPSPAMIWTAEQTARFLQHAEEHRLLPLYRLIALRGLRRGEAAGAKWAYADLATGELTLANEILQVGQDVYEDTPKSQTGARRVVLDSLDIRVLETHRRGQRAELATLNDPGIRDDLMFTDTRGRALEPDWITDEFCRLAVDCGLPPIRLDDLRRAADDHGERGRHA